MVEVHESLSSTNSRAVELSRPYAVVLAEAQTAGRGRLDRSWESPAGLGLTFSAVLPAPVNVPGWVPLAAGLAVAEAVTAVTGLHPQLKWPNDLLVSGLDASGDTAGAPQGAIDPGSGKVCGILCEYLPLPEPLVVVGVGLNVHQRRADLPVTTATSLALALGVGEDRLDREALLVAVLQRLAVRVDQLGGSAAEREATQTAYRQVCATVGTLVTVTFPDGRAVMGTALDVDGDGALVVDDGQQIHTLHAGDVTHVRPGQQAR